MTSAFNLQKIERDMCQEGHNKRFFSNVVVMERKLSNYEVNADSTGKYTRYTRYESL